MLMVHTAATSPTISLSPFARINHSMAATASRILLFLSATCSMTSDVIGKAGRRLFEGAEEPHHENRSHWDGLRGLGPRNLSG